ncbi:MAG: OmpH family outer membrane protein [Chlamydiae bacterium]|nr:OmpH family outer membrane protein [Chlamydiota bacterium]
MKRFLGICALAIAPLAAIGASEKSLNVGVVNFGKCVEASRHGQFEQKQFESLKNQMQKAIHDLDEQLSATATKLQDKDFLDSLSPEAEKELKQKFQNLGEEMQRYQAQYYQVMQQANMRVMHTIADLINEASEIVAKKSQLSLVLNKDAAFHCASALDITDEVISEMDKKFDKEGKSLEQPKK